MDFQEPVRVVCEKENINEWLYYWKITVQHWLYSNPLCFWSHFSIYGGGMISLSLNHVFVIVHGVLWSSKEHLANVPVPLMSGHEAVNVQSAVGLGVSLHVTHRNHGVDAQIVDNGVVMTLSIIKGLLKVVVSQGEIIIARHCIILRLLISLSSLIVVGNAADHIHRP